MPKSMVLLLRMSSIDSAGEAWARRGWWRASGTHQMTFFAGASRKMRYNLSHGNADKYAIAHWGARALGHHGTVGVGAHYLCHRRLQHPAHSPSGHDQHAGGFA